MMHVASLDPDDAPRKLFHMLDAIGQSLYQIQAQYLPSSWDAAYGDTELC
jgi:hypothetical protein